MDRKLVVSINLLTRSILDEVLDVSTVIDANSQGQPHSCCAIFTRLMNPRIDDRCQTPLCLTINGFSLLNPRILLILLDKTLKILVILCLTALIPIGYHRPIFCPPIAQLG